MKKFAFTLAEVLITLAVIGVVAAITLPTLINKYKEHELVTRYKRMYTTLNQAYMRAVAETGETANNWDDMYATALYEKIKPYLKIAEDCPAESNSNQRRKCVGTTDYYLRTYKHITNASVSLSTFYKWPSVRLVTGEFIVFPTSGSGVHFMVDLNGNAGPNQLGVDFHYFSFITPDYTKIQPGARWTHGSPSQPGYCDRTKEGALSGFAGASCGFWILKYNNMDYLHIPVEEVYSKW